jgi:hypothetical protein
MSFSSASSWKKQSSRLKTGTMNLVNNDSIYGENATFNHLECRFGIFSDISASTASFTTISAETAYLDSAYVNDLYITNLGQNKISNDRWLNVDLSNDIYVIDLSSSGNYTSFGGHSLMKQKTAWGATAAGYDAMRNISTRTDLSFANTAFGTGAMTGSDVSNGIIGLRNSAVGFNALSSITTGSSNSALGANALSSNTTGLYNTAAGATSMNLNTTGAHNAAFGSRSLMTNSTGSYNVVCGSCALMMNTTGCNNVSCGHNSMSSNAIGCNNVALGYNAMFKNADASCNTAVGSSSLYSNTSGMGNVAVGAKALYTDVSGSYNTVVGANSDVTNTMLNRNQILGYNNKSAYSNVNIIGADITATGGDGRTFVGNVRDTSSSLVGNVVVYDPSSKEMSYDARMFTKVAADASGYTGLIIGDASQNTFIGANLIMSQGKTIYFSNDKTFVATQYDFSHAYIGFGNHGSGKANFNMDNVGNTATEGSGTFFMTNTAMNSASPIYMINNSPVYLTSSNTTNSIKWDSGTNSLAVTGYNGGYLNGTNGSASKTLIWDASANVGINTTPTYHLDVYDVSNGTNYIISRLKTEAATSGISNTFINVEKGSGFGGVFGGFLNNGGNNSGAVIYGLSSGSRTNNNIVVSKDNIVLDASYSTSLGVRVPSLGSVPGTVFFSAGGYLSNVNTSDPSLKKNIVSLIGDDDIYGKMTCLNPVQYQWIDTNMSNDIKYGFLANEVKALFPTLVSTFKDASGNDKLGYDPVSLIPILTTGILKNVDEIAHLKQENASLKSILSSITERLSALEAKST